MYTCILSIAIIYYYHYNYLFFNINNNNYIFIDKKGTKNQISNLNHDSNNNNNSMVQEIDEALIETAKEADRQKKFVERQSNNLKHRLHNVNREAHSLARHRLNENSNLLFECNDLRMETKELNRKLAIRKNELDVANRTIRELQAQLSSSSGSGSNNMNSTKNNEIKRVKTPKLTTTTTPIDTTTNNNSNNNILEVSDELAESRYPAQWVVHNALIQPDNNTNTNPIGTTTTIPDRSDRINPSSSEPILAPIKGKPILSLNNNKTNIKSITGIQNSQSTSVLMKPSSPIPNIPTTTTLIGIGNNKPVQLNMSKTADIVIKEMKINKKRTQVTGVNNNNNSMSSEWQIEKLNKEINNLATQLDDALREKEIQRLELNRLRKTLMSTSLLSNNSNQLMNTNSYNSTNSNNNMQLLLPNVNKSNNNLNINTNSYTIGNNSIDSNNTLYQQQRQLNHAEIYGVPSEADIEDMQLRPVTPGSAAPILAQNKVYLSNPNILSTKNSSGRVSIVVV